MQEPRLEIHEWSYPDCGLCGEPLDAEDPYLLYINDRSLEVCDRCADVVGALFRFAGWPIKDFTVPGETYREPSPLPPDVWTT